MRVLMLGTPAFAVPTFEALLASRHEVVGLICQPDRPRGRGQKVLAPPTKTVAEAHGVPVFQPLKLKDPALMDAIGALRADIGVVAAYGRILPDALIALPARGMINVHASLLPRYRGAAPIQRAVIAGDDVTGVTIMRVVRELDAGPMLAAASLPIAPDATSVDVERDLATLGAELLVRTVDRLDAGDAVAEVPQDERLVTYASKIERGDGRIDWTQPAERIHNLVRGLHPWPHAFAYLNGERFLIHRTRVGADGTLEILDIQPEGKRVMSMREWLAGRRDLTGPPRFTSEPGMISPARWAAFEALRRSDPARGTGKDLASTLADTRGLVSDPRDRALATELALGAERWRAALDARIAAAAGRAIDTIDFPALVSLRIAVFQLAHLTRTPAHAVVDDAVEIAKRAGSPRAAGFVNAVLRRLLRGSLDAPLPPRPQTADPKAWTAYLTTTLSHPEWLAARWLARYGAEDAERWALFNNQPAPLTVRVNTTRSTLEDIRAELAEDGVEAVPCAHAPDALTMTAGNPMGTRAFREGRVALMDETSQLVGHVAAKVLRGNVLDACASPGGKTLVLACDLPGGARVVAADRRPRPISLLEKSLVRYCLTRIPIIQHDLMKGVPFAALDGVLVDAPCSGLGTIRRDPDVRWRRAEADLPGLAAMQQTLLANAADAVRPGGIVVYATCSSEPEENEHVVDAFLADRRGFARQAIEVEAARAFVDARGDFRTLPHRDGLEAFYAAVLIRTL